MKKRLIPLILASSASLITLNVSAQSFSSFDPRSMGMGGVGVAVSRPDTATFFNPALLSLPQEDDSFSLQIPYIGARVYDPDEFEDSLTATQDAIDVLDATIASIDGSTSFTANDFTALASDTTALNNALIGMDQDLVHAEVGAGIAAGRPSKNLGVGVFVNARLNANGKFNYNDAQVLSELAADATTLSDCITTPSGCGSPTLTSITIGTGTATNPNNVTVNFDTNTNLASTADVRGVLISEVGISFAHNYDGFAIGVTPKYVSVETFDYRATVNAADTDNFDGDVYVEEYSDFNLDFGIAKSLNKRVSVGLVVKNIIEQEYDTAQKTMLSSVDYQARGGAIVLSPQARAGIAYQSNWVTLAADLDLTKNKALGFEPDSQQLAVGAEFDALGVLQLRLGYKADLEDSDRSSASAGLGLAFLGMHIDAAVTGNSDEIGGAFEFGVAF